MTNHLAFGAVSKAFHNRWLWAIVGLALAVRLLALWITNDYEPIFDASDYIRHAESIAAGDGYPESQLVADGGTTAFRPPAYPHFLGGIFAITGDSVEAGRVGNALLGVLAVLLVYVLARRLFDVRTGLAASLLAALFPPLVYESTTILSEPLFVVFVIGFAISVVALRDSPNKMRWAVLAGALCAAAALTRSNGILLIVAIAVGVGTLPATWLRRAQLGAVAALATALVMAPWILRNSFAFDELVLGSTQSGYGLASTYQDTARNDDEYPTSYLAPQFYGPYQSLFREPGVDEVELDAELRERALDYLADDPAYVLKVSVYNTLRIADVIDSRPEVSLRTGGSTVGERAIKFARFCTWVMLMVALVGAVVLTARRRWGPLAAWMVPVLTILPAIPVLAGTRYRAPADPFLCVLAGVALVALALRLAQRRQPGPLDDEPHTPG